MPHSTAARRPVTSLLVLACSGLLAALGGCATDPSAQLPTSMRDPTANFAAFRTYGWSPPPPQAAHAPLSMVDQNMRAAIAGELQRRGYTESQEKPDLWIAFESSTIEKVEDNPVRVGVGLGGWGGNVGGSVSVGSSSTRTVKEGRLAIHAIDAARNSEVWQATLMQRIGKGATDPAAINRAVSEAMKDFPARPTAP